MQLIDRKIDLKVELSKLKITNKNLAKEIIKHKLAEAELKTMLKQKKATT